ncbi:hypothetical protein E4U22_002565 [Claviceps purpurea]|nr:hypothetical protein E4U22_002565 [Claviceps purpurea]
MNCAFDSEPKATTSSSEVCCPRGAGLSSTTTNPLPTGMPLEWLEVHGDGYEAVSRRDTFAGKRRAGGVPLAAEKGGDSGDRETCDSLQPEAKRGESSTAPKRKDIYRPSGLLSV